MSLLDGTAGTGLVNDALGLLDGSTSVDIDTTVLNTLTPNEISIGVRFTVAGEALVAGAAVEHVITAVDNVAGSPTTNISFSPAIAVGSTIGDDAAITYISRKIEVNIGEGNLTYTEAQELEYQYNRGDLDTVRRGQDQPVQVTLNFIYEFVRTGTNEMISPTDAVKGVGGAADWISAAADPCEPYAVTLLVEHAVTCSGTTVEREITSFPTFRYDSLQYDLQAASISVTGRAFTTEAVVTRKV